MAKNPYPSWPELLRSYSVEPGSVGGGAHRHLENTHVDTKGSADHDYDTCHKDDETVPLTHKCVNCHMQIPSPVCTYSPDLSETASLMSSNSADSVTFQSPSSCPGRPPPELCLSPLEEPLQGGIIMKSPYLIHSPTSNTSGESLDQDCVLPNCHISALGMRPIKVAERPKPTSETCTESSTQTEREYCEMIPLSLASIPPPPPPALRSDSRGSLASTVANDVCRICHCESEPEAPLISPCVCCGSLKYVHQACLQQWIKSADTKSCELCRYNFEMTTKIKPFRKWQKLEMTTVERRKIMCSVTFHIIAITCVIWSLYVLIDRTTEEIKAGDLQWPFWTKLIVVAIGFTGGLVFMYVQCKMYVQLCRRWRAYNRVIYIQNCPSLTGQKIPLQPHMLDGNGRQKEIAAPPVNHNISATIQETELL